MSYVLGVVLDACLKLHAAHCVRENVQVEIVLVVGCPGSRGLGTLAGACGGYIPVGDFDESVLIPVPVHTSNGNERKECSCE
jgi:hypothetical protein